VFAEEEKNLDVYWDEGLRLKTKNDNFSMKIGGRFMWDWAGLNPDDETKKSFPQLSGNRAQIRRIRIYTLGTISQDYIYKFQVDFYQLPDVLYKDIYLGRKNIPYLGTIRIGHQFEPFTLEQDTSTKYITFMERALPLLAFDPSRNAGVIMYNSILNNRVWCRFLLPTT
jgi:phosphate-selective porin OprO/OprP